MRLSRAAAPVLVIRLCDRCTCTARTLSANSTLDDAGTGHANSGAMLRKRRHIEGLVCSMKFDRADLASFHKGALILLCIWLEKTACMLKQRQH